MLAGALEISMSEKPSGKVIKTIPMTAKWRSEWKAYKAVAREASELRHKSETLRKAFWAMVENETEDYSHSMRADDEKGVIEVYSNDFDEDED